MRHKIQIVAKYATTDGQTFDTEEQADKHEDLLAKLEPIMCMLPNNKPKAHEYIQHNVEFLKTIKRRLFKLIAEEYKEAYPAWSTLDPDIVEPATSIVGRILDDGRSPLSLAWAKLSRFNFRLGRECEQPFFAINPREATIEVFPTK
jgi:hypothetical protein